MPYVRWSAVMQSQLDILLHFTWRCLCEVILLKHGPGSTAVLYAHPGSAALQVHDITARELHDLLESGSAQPVVIVDTRTDEEQQVSRLPQAISKADFTEHKTEFKHSMVVTYW